MRLLVTRWNAEGLPFFPGWAPRNAFLIFWERGDGRSLARLFTLAPLAVFDVVEISPEMIALARQRTGGSARASYLCQDARTA